MGNPKKRPTKAKKSGAKAISPPLCVAIVACENVLIGTDKTVSLIRVVDTVGLPPDDHRKNGDLIELNMKLFIGLKNAEATGTTNLLLVCVGPNGKKFPIGVIPFPVDGAPEAGRNVISNLRFQWNGDGLYWFNLLLPDAGSTLIARTPLRITQEDSLPKGGNANARKNS